MSIQHVSPHAPPPHVCLFLTNTTREVITSGYLPYNWRTPTMTSYDVQAHPFNRVPTHAVTSPREITDDTNDSIGGDTTSRGSIWSIDDSRWCDCFAGYSYILSAFR